MKRLAAILTFLILWSACSRNSSNEHAGHNATSNNANASANSAADDHDATGHGKSQGAMPSSPGAASAPLDLQFIDSMIAHHKGAVEMATLAESRTKHPELGPLAASIVYDQEREIARMSQWRDEWFEGKPEAVNMEFPGMSHGMQGMDMKKLESLKGRDFDLEFLRQMIPHHEGAIEMAKAIKSGNSRDELKELADDIIAAQEGEIKQMLEWLSAWSR